MAVIEMFMQDINIDNNLSLRLSKLQKYILTRFFYRNVVFGSGGLFCCKIKNGITSWVFHLPKHFGCGPISTYRSERQVSQGRNYHRKGSSDKSKRRWNWVGWLWIGVLRTQWVQILSEKSIRILIQKYFLNSFL